ncbi:hypothetical protein B0H67DRAFT_642595 [Lasiosphaeris hirsuta]|uniref:CHAT domain-containing protein n=1 Tax=Lasiosphaeris hirsuta TaxID=260670 RepID=A0AA40DXH5_9PEZI|nr:hypothetical protein B0H67DRAFT_642595 [Lasiosphaeris hirsuta]
MPPSKSHIIFAVSPPLNSFPFSALPYKGSSPLVLFKSVSIIPSLTTLTRLQDSLASRKPAPISLSVISKSMTRTDLAEYATLQPHNGAEVEAILPMAAIEGMAIARLFANVGSTARSY